MTNSESQQYLNTIISKFNLNFTCQEEVTDVSLLCITLLHKSFNKRPDLQLTLNRKFEALLPLLIRINLPEDMSEEMEMLCRSLSTPLIQHRVAICIGQLSDFLLNTSIVNDQIKAESLWEAIVCWLLEMVTLTDDPNQPVHKVVKLTALNVLDDNL